MTDEERAHLKELLSDESTKFGEFVRFIDYMLAAERERAKERCAKKCLSMRRGDIGDNWHDGISEGIWRCAQAIQRLKD